MLLSQLLAALPQICGRFGPDADPEIAGVTADSRQLVPGALFVAVRGENFDGRAFIPQAVAQGAVAVVTAGSEAADEKLPKVPIIFVPDAREALAWLSAAWHGFPARRLVMIGVTGTDGKTTTASLIHSILCAAGIKAGLISTVSAVIGAEVLDTGFHVTTPEAPQVQAYLARMAAAGLTHCVLEATSHGLAQSRVSACEFDVAVLTNLTHEHLDYHQTFENYRAAKGRLFAGLQFTAPKPGAPSPVAVLNADDAECAWFRSQLGRVPACTYALRSAADVRADDIRLAAAGLSFTVIGPAFEIPVTCSLTGGYNVLNCLAAVTTAVCALRLPPEAASRGLAGFTGVAGRMERIEMGQPFIALVDFAHTPHALRCALETARGLAAGRVIAVCGSAGRRDTAKRHMMARTAVELAAVSIFTAEDPRTEPLAAILDAMAAGAHTAGAVERTYAYQAGKADLDRQGEDAAPVFFRVPDRREAIRLAVQLASPGDVVIVCGKGHEQSMCFGTIEYPWDDRTALRAALAERLGMAGPPMPFLPDQTMAGRAAET